MNLRHRLHRLECRTPARSDFATPAYDHAAYQAYLNCEGPRPPEMPCPPWAEPHAWAWEERRSRYIDELIRGDRQPGDYVPGMGKVEGQHADQTWEALLQVAAEQTEAVTCEPA